MMKLKFEDLVKQQPAIRECLNTLTPRGIELAILTAYNEGYNDGWVRGKLRNERNQDKRAITVKS